MSDFFCGPLREVAFSAWFQRKGAKFRKGRIVVRRSNSIHAGFLIFAPLCVLAALRRKRTAGMETHRTSIDELLSRPSVPIPSIRAIRGELKDPPRNLPDDNTGDRSRRNADQEFFEKQADQTRRTATWNTSFASRQLRGSVTPWLKKQTASSIEFYIRLGTATRFFFANLCALAALRQK